MKVVLGVSGGIAAYKAAEIVRRLVERGVEVQVIMTPAAQRFIAPLTLSVLSKRPVISDLWDPASGAVDHIDLARRSDVLAIAPATADSLAKLARGIADDVLSTYALSHRREVVVAPAMNTWMWSHDATQENVGILRQRGVEIVEPDAGDLACGDVGPGRLAPPDRIAGAILDVGRRSGELSGWRVLVTAGPTREPLDPVRFLSNRSSGRMGFALAREAIKRGAEVTLISGPVSLAAPPGLHELVEIERTAEMREAVLERLQTTDALVMAAAPADFTPIAPAGRKLKRSQGTPTLALGLAPDILKAVSERRRENQVVVAFAAETHDLLANAKRKLREKRVDLLVGNDVSKAGTGFDSEDNEVVILSQDAADEHVPRARKARIAAHILDRIAPVLEARCPRNLQAIPSSR